MSKQRSTSFQRISLVGLTFGIGIAFGILGVLVFQHFAPQNEHTKESVAESDIGPNSTHRSNSSYSEISADVARFREIFKQDTIAEQYSALHFTLSQATEQELGEWWIESKKIERASHREIAQQVILRNLSAKNPQEAFRRIDEISILQIDAALRIVFSEWAVLHLENAIQAAITLDRSRRTVALRSILEIRDDLSEAEQHSIATQLESEETFLKFLSDSKISKSIEAPEESWKMLLDDAVDDVLQTKSLTKVAEAWRAQKGFEVLRNIYLDVEDYSTKVQLLRSITQADPEGALDFVRGLPAGEDQSVLSSLVVQVWARADPQAALATVSTYAPSSLTSDLEREIARTWARTNPKEMIENVEAISPEYRAMPLATAFQYIAREDPRQAIATLGSVEHLVGNTSTLVESIVREWADQEPEIATDWVLENFTREAPERRALLEWVLRSLARENPKRAFELAIEQPSPSTGFGLDYYVMREITQEGEIELAKQLLPRVSEPSKSVVFRDMAAAMVDEGQTSEAVELGQDLEESNQRSYYQSVFASWARSNPKNLMESLEGLPSSTIKSIAAMQLITRNQRNPVFTDDQLDLARTFLNAEDQTSVKRYEDR